MSFAVKLFTHTDLDGVGCSIVGKQVFGEGNIDVEYCNYEEIDEKVQLFLENRHCAKYDVIFITDISVSDDVVQIIDRVCPEKVVLLDHHATAVFLNSYKWASVYALEPDPWEAGEMQKSSGTSLFYYWCANNGLCMRGTSLEAFVEAVRQYDTWDWKNLYNTNYPKDLNDLLTLLGRYQFVNRFMRNLDLLFTKTERTLLDVETKRREYYMTQRVKRLREVTTPEGYKVGVVFAEQYQSELGNKLAEENPHLDFIAMINMATSNFSYRSNRGTVHLGEYAATRGGGGHPPSAGSPIAESAILHVIDGLLKNIW